MPDATALADPAILARIGDLELIARRIVDGVVSGLHRSPFHGYSAEFSQYRHYRPGDDLKYLDWKLFARTDRLYTKQYRETTNLAACLVLDASASMAFAGRGALTKWRYAAILAAAIVHLLATQGDHVGLIADQEGGQVYVKPRGGPAHARALLARLSRLVPAGAWHAAHAVRTAVDRLARRGVLLVFSDVYDWEDELAVLLRQASRMGHEVALFQVLTRDEIELSYTGTLEFEEPERGARAVIDADAVRRRYQERVAGFIGEVRARAHADGLDYTLLLTDEPLDHALRRYLVRQPHRS